MKNKLIKSKKIIVLLIIIFVIIAIILRGYILNRKKDNELRKTYVEVEETFFDDISKREYEIIGENVYLLKEKVLKNPKYEDMLLPNFKLISDYLKTEYPEIKMMVTVYSINEAKDGINVFFNPIIKDCVVAEDTLGALGTSNGKVHESIVDNLDDFVEICKYDMPELVDEEIAKTNAINVFKENRSNIETNLDQTINKEYYLGFIEGTYYYSFDVGKSYVIVNAEDGNVIESSFEK